MLGKKDAIESASNLPLAANLKGKLFLIHGTRDACVPFSDTMNMVDALIRAVKHFDLLVLPGVGTSTGERPHPNLTSRTYAFEAARRYFQEHLKP